MNISVDGVPALDIEVNLDAMLDLDNGTAWVGFTSATARAWENHDILSWSFTSMKSATPAATPQLGEGAHSPGPGLLVAVPGENGVPPAPGRKLD